ncbi:hypothetical protein D9615_007710 [Tricholomella constricta]|uniref:DUF1838 domain-containing protein n=1 Tax=Tricholomella constricta TaxID=117010 RepID=A0A8H5H3W3_9AGAR|nr:hypothetical protein D9615_007710 [Tricholomella constricta]
MRVLHFAGLLSVLFFSINDAKSTAAISPTRKLSAEDLMRIRASTDAKQSTIVQWEGQVLSYKPGEQPKVTFNVLGMNIARAVKMADGTYDLLSREFQLYLDPVTDKVINVWQNPYSGKKVPVVHVANNPVYQSFPPGQQYVAKSRPGRLYTLQLSIPLSYPNSLNPTGDLNSPFFPYSGTQKLAAIESFTFTFPASEISGKSKSLPSTQVYWTRTSALLPWMATPNTNTTLLFIGNGAKVAGGWKNLNPVLRDVVKKILPAYKEAPLARTSPGGGVSSWSYFAQPEVFQAYLNGSIFPLRDDKK